MNKERIAEIKKLQITEMEPVIKEITQFYKDDKKFYDFAKSEAKKVMENNIGVLDLFEMIKLADDYLNEGEKYNKYLESKKTKTKTKTKKKDEEVNETVKSEVKEEKAPKKVRKPRAKKVATPKSTEFLEW